MSKYNLVDLYEGMSEKEYEAAKEAERLEAHPERDKIKAIQALMSKEKKSKAVKTGEKMGFDMRGIDEDIEEGTCGYDRDAKTGKKLDGPGGLGKVKENFLAVHQNEEKLDRLRGAIDDDNYIINSLIDSIPAELATKYLDNMIKIHIGIVDDGDLDESTGPSDKAETEDDVVNVDKVAGPGAKGTGYGAETSANTAEDDQEDKEIQDPPPMYEDMNLVSLAKKLGIDLDDLKGRIEKMKSTEKDKIEADAFSKSAIAEKKGRIKEYMEIESYADYEDIAQAYMEAHQYRRRMLRMSNKQLETLGKRIVDDKYDGDVGKAYDEIVKSDYKPKPDSTHTLKENGDVEDFTDELKEEDKDEYKLRKMVINLVMKEKSVPISIAQEFFETHYDDIIDMNSDEILDEFDEYASVNYDSIDEDEKLKEHFKRFM